MAHALPAEILAALAKVERRPSWPEAMATALLPLVGVLVFDWPAAAVLGLYWLDNVLIGTFHLAKMFSAQGRMLDPNYEATLRSNTNWDDAQKDLMVRNAKAVQHHVMPWFFLVHYGLFCAAHAGFIAMLFDGAFGDFNSAVGLLTLAVMLAQHALDLHAFRRDPELVVLPRVLLMFQPYPRVIVLHLALLLGMLPALAGYPIVAALILAAFKLWFDRSQVLSTLTLLRRKSLA